VSFIDIQLNVDTIYNKNICQVECDFKKYGKTPIVKISLPKEPEKFLGMIISEDPTTAFICPYKFAMRRGDTHSLIKNPAPPKWLIQRITEYQNKYCDGQYSNQIEKLQEKINNNFYWTHMLKCCTMKSKKLKALPEEMRISIPFRHDRGMICAKTWLLGELKDAVNKEKVKCIIVLGKSPKTCVEQFVVESDIDDDRFVYLPHPSSANMKSWNPKKEKDKNMLDCNLTKLFNNIESMN